MTRDPYLEADVAACIPWFGHDSRRSRNVNITWRSLHDSFPSWTIVTGAGRSLSHARNLLVQRFAPNPEMVLVFNDADTIAQPEQLRDAVVMARSEPGLVFPFDTYLRLSQAATSKLNHWSEAFSSAVEQEMFEPPSVGVVAIRRDCFEQVGGFDEQFVGWGYEDIAFRYACSQLWPERRVSGEAVHLWHGPRNPDDSPVGGDPALVAANKRRLESILGHPVEA